METLDSIQQEMKEAASYVAEIEAENVKLRREVHDLEYRSVEHADKHDGWFSLDSTRGLM